MSTLEEVTAKLESVENELATVKDDLEFYKSIFKIMVTVLYSI